MRLKEKRIVITGAGRGIGAACVRACLKEGATILGVSRTESELKALAATLEPFQDQFNYEIADVGNEKAVEHVFAKAVEKLGGVDGLVNSAAIIYKALVEDLTLTDWQQVLAINLTGPFLCCRQAFKEMDNGGTIVNVGSLSGVPGVQKFEGFTAYNVSKYGVLGLTEILALEGSTKNIRVNCVSPGAVRTKMLKQAAPNLLPAMEPDEVAETIVFLLSESSRAINGENIILAGHPDGPLSGGD